MLCPWSLRRRDSNPRRVFCHSHETICGTLLTKNDNNKEEMKHDISNLIKMEIYLGFQAIKNLVEIMVAFCEPDYFILK